MNMFVLIYSGVDWSDIQNIIAMCIVESLIRQGETTQHDEQNATPNERFHGERVGV